MNLIPIFHLIFHFRHNRMRCFPIRKVAVVPHIQNLKIKREKGTTNALCMIIYL